MLLHPIRGRIMMILEGRTLTTRQLAALMPDVPPPSIYRHLRILLDGGAVEVAGEQGTGRSAERLYARPDAAGELTQEDLRREGPEARMEHYSAFLGLLLSQIQVSLRRIPLRESSRYICAASPIFLPEAQSEAFKAELKELISRYQAPPDTDSDRVTFATLLFPEPPLPQAD
jgi:DNA-binding transcriptional ArsR family regulator